MSSTPPSSGSGWGPPPSGPDPDAGSGGAGGGWGGSSGGLPGEGSGSTGGSSGGLPGEGADSGGGWGTPSGGGQGGQGWGAPAGQGGGQGWDAQGGQGWGAPGGQVQPGGWGGSPGVAGGQLAGWGPRLGAYLLDGLIIAVPIVVVSIVLGLVVGAGAATTFDPDTGQISDGGAAAFGLLQIGVSVAGILLAVVYYGYFYGKGRGQTLGKKVVNLRVVRDDGQPTTFGFGALREVLVKQILFGTIGIFLCGIPFLLNYLWPLWDDNNETLHDKLVSTHVVRD